MVASRGWVSAFGPWHLQKHDEATRWPSQSARSHNSATKRGNGVIRGTTRQQPAPQGTKPPPLPVRRTPQGRLRCLRVWPRRSGRRNPGNREQGRCHGETKLAQHESHGPTSGTKLALLAQNCPFLARFARVEHTFYRFRQQKPRRASFPSHRAHTKNTLTEQDNFSFNLCTTAGSTHPTIIDVGKALKDRRLREHTKGATQRSRAHPLRELTRTYTAK